MSRRKKTDQGIEVRIQGHAYVAYCNVPKCGWVSPRVRQTLSTARVMDARPHGRNVHPERIKQ